MKSRALKRHDFSDQRLLNGRLVDVCSKCGMIRQTDGRNSICHAHAQSQDQDLYVVPARTGLYQHRLSA